MYQSTSNWRSIKEISDIDKPNLQRGNWFLKTSVFSQNFVIRSRELSTLHQTRTFPAVSASRHIFSCSNKRKSQNSNALWGCTISSLIAKEYVCTVLLLQRSCVISNCVLMLPPYFWSPVPICCPIDVLCRSSINNPYCLFLEISF